MQMCLSLRLRFLCIFFGSFLFFLLVCLFFSYSGLFVFILSHSVLDACLFSSESEQERDLVDLHG